MRFLRHHIEILQLKFSHPEPLIHFVNGQELKARVQFQDLFFLRNIQEIFELFQTAFQEDRLFLQVRLQYHEVLKGCLPYFSAFSQRQFFCICSEKYPQLLQKFLVCPHPLKKQCCQSYPDRSLNNRHDRGLCP